MLLTRVSVIALLFENFLFNIMIRLSYPLSAHLYTDINGTHLSGPLINHNFNSYVCNKEMYEICKIHDINFIGIAKDESDILELKGASAFLTYRNTSLVQVYNVPVYGLTTKYIDYGLQSHEPYFIQIYN